MKINESMRFSTLVLCNLYNEYTSNYSLKTMIS